jgi:hypothetical protein
VFITLQLDPQSRAKIRHDAAVAARVHLAITDGLLYAAQVAADEVSGMLMRNELGLKTQHGADGIAGSVSAWLSEPSRPEAAFGVREGSPAYAYARIQQDGGTIVPKNAKALAVPVSDEARKHTSPRDMEGLTLIPRDGKPPLLVRQLQARGARREQWQIHWVLVPSVTLPATHWLTDGAQKASDEVGEAFGERFWDVLLGSAE